MKLDMVKLISIMRMTESASDGEALNALRLANRMLKANGKHWGDVLGASRSPSAASPDYRTPPSKRGKGNTSRYGRAASQKRHDDGRRHTGSDIDDMLATLTVKKHDVSTLMFLASMRDFWERNSFLTTPQYEALTRMYEGRENSTGGGGGGRWRF